MRPRAPRGASLAVAGLLGAAAALAAVSGPAQGVVGSARGVPAQWRTYDLLIGLQSLPRSYSCTDLWYRFRDVLLQIGARHFMLIEPYHCAVKGGGPAYSPSVHLKFQLPQPLKPDEARYADVSSVEKTVLLAPGERSLRAVDCNLVEQMGATLFPAIPVHVSATTFHCRAAHPSYAVRLRTEVAAAPAGRVAGVPRPIRGG